MRIRFTNPFLAIIGSILGILNFFYPTFLGLFMFGWCFGMIWLNYKDDKNGSK